MSIHPSIANSSRYNEEEDGDKRETKIVSSNVKTDEGQASTLKLQFQAIRRNVRRKVTVFADEPLPLPVSPTTIPSSSLNDATEQDDLHFTLIKSRKRDLSRMNINLVDLREEQDVTASEPNKGVVFTEATTLAVKPAAEEGMASGEEVVPILPPPPPPLDPLTVPDREYEGFPTENQVNIRRTVSGALQFLSQLGIRPQLCSESAPPIQDGRLRHSTPSASTFTHIKIEHLDEEGNILGPKEAYKELSHRFHGTKSSKGKLEKLRRRREQAKRVQATSLSDISVDNTKALRQKPIEKGQPVLAAKEVMPVSKASSSKGKAIPSNLPKIFGIK